MQARGRSSDCPGKGETEHDKSQPLSAIPGPFFDIGLRPEGAVLAKGDSRVRVPVAPPNGPWRHNRRPPTPQTEPHERAGNQDPPRSPCSAARVRQTSRIPTIWLVLRRKDGPP